MNHRHLFPNEIDLLLDGEGGFGVAPLRSHAAECPDCRARLEEARVSVDALEGLTHLAPSVNLADRVMAQVPVFVPWHVAARDTAEHMLQNWAPRSRPVRTAVYAGAATVFSLLSLAMIWIATQTDLLAVAGALAGEGARQLAGGVARDLAGLVLGEATLAAIQQAGSVGVALAGAGFLLAAAGTLLGLRAIASSARRQS